MAPTHNRRAEALFDRILIAVAALATLVAAVLAVAAILSPNPAPRFSGAEHLNIFGRPARYAARPSHVGAPTPAPASQEIDMTPIGSIQRKPEAAPAPRDDGWRVHDVVAGRAWLIGPQGLRIVEPGADLGDLGAVTDIRIEREGYVVMTTKGRIGPAR